MGSLHQPVFSALLRSLKLGDGDNSLQKWNRRFEVAAAMAEIRESYLNPSGAVINYTNYSYQIAYCLLYLTSHIYMVHSVFDKIDFLSFITSIPNPKVCSIGGGPGTEILAMLMNDKLTSLVEIKSWIFDLHVEWSTIYNNINRHWRECGFLKGSYQVQYKKFDFSQDMTVQNRQLLQEADLVMIVKSLSAFPQHNYVDQTRTFLQNLKPGTMVLVIDNRMNFPPTRRGAYLETMEDIAKQEKFLLLNESGGNHFHRLPQFELNAMNNFQLLPKDLFEIESSQYGLQSRFRFWIKHTGILNEMLYTATENPGDTRNQRTRRQGSKTPNRNRQHERNRQFNQDRSNQYGRVRSRSRNKHSRRNASAPDFDQSDDEQLDNQNECCIIL